MTLQEFKQSLYTTAPPEGICQALKALWHDAKGDWNAAHQLAQSVDSADGAWVHAYLHRKEGDHSNATYWYRCANTKMFEGSIEEEWNAITSDLLRPR